MSASEGALSGSFFAERSSFHQSISRACEIIPVTAARNAWVWHWCFRTRRHCPASSDLAASASCAAVRDSCAASTRRAISGEVSTPRAASSESESFAFSTLVSGALSFLFDWFLSFDLSLSATSCACRIIVCNISTDSARGAKDGAGMAKSILGHVGKSRRKRLQASRIGVKASCCNMWCV